MIAAGHTRRELLAEIQASPTARRLLDPNDVAFLDLDPVCLVLRKHTREEILPRVREALVRRYRAEGPDLEHLDRHLLRPLKNALGNAWKRGNRRDRAKWLTVEVTATRRGAVVAVTDQGRGFDVRKTLRRFRRRERYFKNKGGGIQIFDRVESLVSFADGGRTVLLRYLRAR